MATISFAVVDVFSPTAFKGNPLAVVDNTADSLTDTQMKLIARQFNLSETTFFSQPTLPNANYRLRSFLPDSKEVFGAGHNILGVWWYLAQSGRLDFSGQPSKLNDRDVFTFWQELGTQVSPVNILRRKVDGRDEFSVSLRQAPPGSHGVHPDKTALATSIGLAGADIGFQDDISHGGSSPDLEPQVMSTSTARHLIVPVASIDALDRVTVQRDKLLPQLVLADKGAYGIYLVAQDSNPVEGECTYRARFFSPGMSSEDPATGSAAGPLSAYLQRNGRLPLIDGAATIEVVQGLNLGRRCTITVHLSADNEGHLEVDIAGDGASVMEGSISVPEPSLVF